MPKIDWSKLRTPAGALVAALIAFLLVLATIIGTGSGSGSQESSPSAVPSSPVASSTVAPVSPSQTAVEPSGSAPAPSAPAPSDSATATPTPTQSATPVAVGCVPSPSACGFPDATNTGVPAGYPLTDHPGTQRITVAGTVIDGWNSGTISVEAPNVTIRNSRITSSSYWGIHGSGASGLLVENVTVVGQGRCDVGVDSGSQTILRSNVSGCVDGIHAHGNNVIRDNYIRTKASADNTSHDDGIQVVSGAGLVIQHNTIDMTQDGRANSAIFVQQSSGTIDGLTIDSNLLDGGGYTLYIEEAANVVASNNRIGPDYKFGRISTAHGGTPQLVGNVADESGAPIS